MPLRYWSVDRDDCLPHAKQRNGFERVLSLMGDGALVALVGGRGPGKTQIASWVIREVCCREQEAKYTTCKDILLAIKETYGAAGRRTERDVIRKLAGPELLVIDEIHERSNSEWEDGLLVHLLNRRYSAMRDTIVISNQKPEELAESVGASVIDRIRETGEIILCDWPSVRAQVRKWREERNAKAATG